MIYLGDKPLSVGDFYRVLFENEKVQISASALDKVQKSHDFLKSFAKNKIIYGINTGLGPMAQYKIKDEEQKQLQLNLIRSHASGMGNDIPLKASKSAVLARLNTLLQAYSGVHVSVVELLTNFINLNIIPAIPEHGGVGASGDLVQLAHIALNLIGEGEVYFQNEKMPAEDAFRKAGLNPIEMHVREGLALMNGTSVMSGIGMLNLIRSNQLIEWSTIASALINEIVEAYDDHLSEALNGVKHHVGQSEIARKLRHLLEGSVLTRDRQEHLYNQKQEVEIFEDKVQEYYSLRCVPQVLGPILDTVKYTTQIVVDEIQSANDNPIIKAEEENVFHGGNFHGDYVALEMDKLRIVITKLSMLAERQINFLMNHKINGILPPFVNLGTLGLNLGMQGVQFTAVSTTAENQTLATPIYTHSIPNNNDNQDIVSMGTNSALLTAKVIDNAFQVLSIEMLTLAQAVDALSFQNKISKANRHYYELVRNEVPAFKEDDKRYPDVMRVYEMMKNTHFNL
ncbi:MAG: aromatic amino acid lyase [Bacteroidales bacterium]|nr:aromatic amino acid lyase [Bacteroidales bacterium]